MGLSKVIAKFSHVFINFFLGWNLSFMLIFIFMSSIIYFLFMLLSCMMQSILFMNKFFTAPVTFHNGMVMYVPRMYNQIIITIKLFATLVTHIFVTMK